MRRHRLGQEEKAKNSLASAVLAFDWNAARADDASEWIYLLLRREAEAMILMILPNLSEFLRGNCQPRSQDERLALLGICQFKGLYQTVARLYAEAFAADPKLAEDLNSQIRYNAARYASLAG
jgi:eukaryotic-like serine/threonine-protein kinase